MMCYYVFGEAQYRADKEREKMSLQLILDNESISKIPVVLKAILMADEEKKADEMAAYSLREIEGQKLNEMNDDDRRNFQVQLVTMFKIKGWI